MAAIPLAVVAAFAVPDAQAAVVDRVEILQAESEAEIRIAFTQRIQYLRHAPLNKAETLRISLQLSAVDPRELESLIQEVKNSPRSDLIEPFKVEFPEVSTQLKSNTAVLAIRFGKLTPFRVRPNPDGLSISLFVPAIDRKPTAAAEPETSREPLSETPIAAEDVERRAAILLNESRAALRKGDPGIAIESLNRLLNLPPNQSSEAAQFLIAEARERNREPDKARAEFELYLKLYPDGPSVVTVRERLADLGTVSTEPKPGEARAPMKWQVFGSVSQYYYTGKSQVETTTTPTPEQVVQGQRPFTDKLSLTDQSAILSTIDVNARLRGETTDSRLVIRDSNTYNFLKDQKGSQNRLTAAYAEHGDRQAGYFVRAGRQPGNTAGLLSRFDGVWGSYQISPKVKVNATAGQPDEVGSRYNKSFFGASIETVQQPEQVSAQLYFIHQKLKGGLTDRQAVGAEVRYFDSKRSALGLIDYDTRFRALNVATVQANYLAETGTSYFSQIDVRRGPTLQMSNLSFADPSLGSISDLVDRLGSKEAIRRIKVATPKTKLFLAGFTHPVTQKWQVGADFRLSNISGFTSQFGDLLLQQTDPPTPDTKFRKSGNSYIYTAQTTGTSVVRENDTLTLSTSIVRGKTPVVESPAPTVEQSSRFSGYALSATHSWPISDRWRLDSAFNWYSQKDNVETKLRRLAPTLRVSYRVRDSVTLEAQAGTELSRNDSATVSDRSKRHFFYVGYRWDFS